MDSGIGALILWGVISLVVWLVVEGGWAEAIVRLWESGWIQRSLASPLAGLIVLVCSVFAVYGAVALIHFIWRIT